MLGLADSEARRNTGSQFKVFMCTTNCGLNLRGCRNLKYKSAPGNLETTGKLLSLSELNDATMKSDGRMWRRAGPVTPQVGDEQIEIRWASKHKGSIHSHVGETGRERDRKWQVYGGTIRIIDEFLHQSLALPLLLP